MDVCIQAAMYPSTCYPYAFGVNVDVVKLTSQFDLSDQCLTGHRSKIGKDISVSVQIEKKGEEILWCTELTLASPFCP